jgi:hypothetical protein
MSRKLVILLLISCVFCIFPLFSAEKQVRVSAAQAPVYAEANTHSYKIETVKKGTILSVFESGSSDTEWLYIRYRSERWKSIITGFIQASMVQAISEEPEEKPEVKPEPEKVEPKPAQATKETAEEKKIILPQREQIEEGVRPKIEKPETKPAKIEPKIEQVLVNESISLSPLPPPASYVLPEVRLEEKPRTFMSREAIQAVTESPQKKSETVIEVTEKAPKKLEERKPPEATAVQPKPAAKKKAVQEEEKPVEKKPEQKQIVPQITSKKPPRPMKPKLPGKWPFLSLNIGYGPAQGSGLGGSLQLNTGLGFSLSLGAGYYPTSYFYSEYDWVKSEILFSAGIKYYLPFKNNRFHPYLSLQYGGLSVEAVRLVTGIWNYQYIYENIQKTLYGPSLLAGLELKLGMIGLNGAIGISYNMTEWDYWDRNYFFTGDVGLLIFIW